MRLLLGLVGALLLTAGPARALESSAVSSPRLTASLVSETDEVASGQAFRVGLRLRMTQGWHIYWRNPGDAGIPPELQFVLPDGVRAGDLAWPAPSTHAEGPLMTYGYDGQVLLVATVAGATGPVTVQLHASWLVCEKICVPEEGDFRLDLPGGSPTPSPQAGLFAAADARVPGPSPWLAEIATDGRLRLMGPGLNAAGVTEARFFPDTSGQIVDTAAQPLSTGADSLTLALKPGREFRTGLAQTGVVVLHTRDRLERAVQVLAAPVAATMGPAELAALAFLGGLILNLMPCVFPILAVKAVGLARLAGRPRGQAWASGLAYAAGVVVTFLTVALALLALRQAGVPAGWGSQFQAPGFVAAMALLLFAVGLNFSGVFTVGGPIGAGQNLAGRRGLSGSFFTGLLAVLVATPCTAPFMGAAIAAGLAGSATVTLAVFLAMGLGLAAPYVLLTTVPWVARAMPRPGRWMQVLQQALAFPMYAASGWLVWVLSQEAGPEGVLAVAVGLVLLGLSGWTLGLAQSVRPGRGRRLAVGAAAIAASLAVAAILPLATTRAQAALAVAEAGVEPFTAARLAALQAAGRPVFVNMTAAWCVTCLVNERLTLASDRIRQEFTARRVVYLKGDWTRQDPEITRFLQAHGREGVPFYALFPGGGGPPAVLPQILTAGTVIEALGRLGD